jgi:ribonuclease P protein component
MTTDAPAGPAKNPVPPRRLRRRREFLRAAKNGVRASGRLFTIQMVEQDAAADPAGVDARPRFGLTVTKKVAGAVGRNRIRRRLREALRTGAISSPGHDAIAGLGAITGLGARPGQDYVIIARREALNAPFAEIVSQMAEGFGRLQDRRTARGRRNQTERTGVPRDE